MVTSETPADLASEDMVDLLNAPCPWHKGSRKSRAFCNAGVGGLVIL
jgi:hypothetical protein